MKAPMTMWESKTFIRQSEALMSPEEASALKFYLGLQPEAGDLIPAVIKSIRDEHRKKV